MRRLLAIFFGCVLHAGFSQQLYLDSLLTQPIAIEEFNSASWYWFKLEAEESSSFIELKQWGHVIGYPASSNQSFTTGRRLNGEAKSYYSHKNILDISQQKERSFLIKVKGEHPLFDLNKTEVIAYTANEWRQSERQRLLIHGLFFGIVIVMALYNLMIYFSVKDQSYLWYVFSIFGFGLYMAFYYGFTFEHFWPSSPYWNAHFFALIIPLTNMGRIMFTKTYLHTDSYVPKWDKAFNILLILYILPIVTWFVSWYTPNNWLVETNHIIGFLGTMNMILITLVSIVVYRKGYDPALWFLIAFSLFNFGGVLFIFRELNYLPDNFLTRYVIQIGAVAQVVLFSFGLSSRLNRTRKLLSMRTLEKEKLAKKQEAEKKRMIEKQRNELEVKVKRRTQELEELLIQLKASEGELRELNQIKSRLFAIISHELKSPLTTVDSYLNLLMNHYSKLSPEELSDLSHKTRFALQNLTLLLDNLLLWSRLQQDAVVFAPKKVELYKIIDKSLKLFQPLIDQKKLHVTIDESIDEAVLFCDLDMLAFVVRNLIHNAIKFTPKNGNIRISALDNNESYTITIEDSGVGMTSEMIDQILNKGEGFTNEGTENEKGSGIGLIMCKEFVERNSGQLTIKAHRGTKISFTTPTYILH